MMFGASKYMIKNAGVPMKFPSNSRRMLGMMTLVTKLMHFQIKNDLGHLGARVVKDLFCISRFLHGFETLQI